MTDLYSCTPRSARSHICDIIQAGLVPNIMSSPGMGKSSIVKSIAKQFGLYVIDHRLSTSQPEDLSGLPEFRTTPDGRRVASFTPFDIFPSESTPIPEGYDGWLLFFDEFNSGQPEVQAACYKIILDRMVGQTKLHDRVAMACAGNLMTDRAITNNISTAMQSRLVHLQMILSHDEWMEDVALAEEYDERIIGYHNFDKDALFDFRPDHQDKTFCCPRTWEFMNKLVKGKEVTDEKTTMYAGTITSGHAAAFVQFSHIYKELMTIKQVLADPEGAPVYGDHEPQRQWGIVTHLMKHVTKDNFGDIATYVNRMGLTHRILFYRRTMVTLPELRQHPAFINAAVQLNKYLRPDAYDQANAHRGAR